MLLFVYPNRGAVPDALIIQQRMKDRMGSIVRAKEGYVFVHYKLFSLAIFCVCVYVSRTVFFFRCPVKIQPLPLTVDMRPLSQPSFHLVSFKIAIGNATFIHSSTSAFASKSSSSVSASTSQLRPVTFLWFRPGVSILIHLHIHKPPSIFFRRLGAQSLPA